MTFETISTDELTELEAASIGSYQISAIDTYDIDGCARNFVQNARIEDNLVKADCRKVIIRNDGILDMGTVDSCFAQYEQNPGRLKGVSEVGKTFWRSPTVSVNPLLIPRGNIARFIQLPGYRCSFPDCSELAQKLTRDAAAHLSNLQETRSERGYKFGWIWYQWREYEKDIASKLWPQYVFDTAEDKGTPLKSAASGLKLTAA